MRAVNGEGAYANLVTAELIDRARLDGRDAALATELVFGTLRAQGTYDRIIEAAAGRRLSTLQPAVVDLLRLGVHQLLGMRTPAHAAVDASVLLAREAVGERVTGLVNAILRKIAASDLAGWLGRLSAGLDPLDALALRTFHPRWIVDAYADLLPADELEPALAANNVAPVPTLVVRPGLAEVAELGGTPTSRSPFGARREGRPSDVPVVREGRAGVQDEGSQLVALALAEAAAPAGAWLDLCAGPGGKAALLTGLAREQGSWLLAVERQPHRAELVRRALAAYPDGHVTIVADGTRPAWSADSFARVLADVPCTGLGALRRRPEARWRRRPSDLDDLVPLQRALLASAVDAAMPGGVVVYATCSPHRRETIEVVAAAIGVRVERTEQLWPHRDDTDAMFWAVLRKL